MSYCALCDDDDDYLAPPPAKPTRRRRLWVWFRSIFQGPVGFTGAPGEMGPRGIQGDPGYLKVIGLPDCAEARVQLRDKEFRLIWSGNVTVQSGIVTAMTEDK